MLLAVLIIPLIVYPYFIITTPIRYYLYSITILLYMLSSVGACLKIMHLPGGDEFLMIGLASELLAGTFLIISGIKSEDLKFKVYKIILGVLLIAYFLLAVSRVSHDYDLHSLVVVFPCAILLIAGWIILSKRTLHKGEMNLLIVILVQSILVIAAHLEMAPLI